jgi:2-succinyl-6-hydroxy-2,4-cyclohexadiene-1-carboxylate synthase
VTRPARERRIPLDGAGSVRVRVWGDSGTPLLLIHGFLGGVEDWGDLPLRLTSRFQVAAVDLPGHGSSDGAADPDRYRIPRIARDLEVVQSAVFQEPAWWLGYSMGGRIAVAAAAEGVAIRGLLLESASPGIRDAGDRALRRALDEERAIRIESVGMAGFVREWLDLPLFAGLAGCPAPIRSVARRLRESQDGGRMAAWLRGGGTGSQPSYWESLQGLRLPVRVLAGGEDPRFVALGRAMAAAAPDGSLRILPGVGHLPHLEDPEGWLDWVLASALPGPHNS